MKTCPICGHPGDDLVFNFYCSNPVCQNYVAPKVPVQQESTTKHFFYMNASIIRNKKPEIIITNGYGLSIDDIVTSFQHIDKQSIAKNDRVLGFPVQVPQLYPMRDIVPINFSKYIESKNASSYDIAKDDVLISLPIKVVKTVHRIQLNYTNFDYHRRIDGEPKSIPIGKKK
jgi:hypothetical protein